MSNNNDEIKSGIIHGEGPKPNRGRWVKGKSGNPQGRPPKEKQAAAVDASMDDKFLDFAKGLTKINENGKLIEMPRLDVVMHAEFRTGVKGSSHAQRNIFDRYRHALNVRMKKIEDNYQWWRNYINVYDLIVKDFEKRGEPLPDYYPHPNELRFEDGKFVTGGFGRTPFEASILLQHYIKVRNALLLQSEKDRRHYRCRNALDCISGRLALLIDAILPERVQFDLVSLTIQLGKLRGIPKRELQHRLTEAWAEIGAPDAAKFTTCPVDEATWRHSLQKTCDRHFPGVVIPL